MTSLGEELSAGRRFPGFDTLRTPAVVVDEPVLDANLARMAARVSGKAALHPHVKTHKSLALARMQFDTGAAGLTASRAAEAAVFIDAGLGPVTIAYPLLDVAEIAALMRLADRRQVSLRFVVDSPAGIERLAAASAGLGPVLAFIKVDVGLNRCGIAPDTDAPLRLAEDMARHRVGLAGLLSHAGHAYGADRQDEIVDIARQECAVLADLQARLRGSGFDAPILSVGSTPTLLGASIPEAANEVRPGNYVFLDLTARNLGIAATEEISLGVAATVISAHDGIAVIDAGSKTLSSDRGAHGSATNHHFGEAWAPGRDMAIPVLRLSEEHGVIDNDVAKLAVGDRVLVLPNHSCPVVNLAFRLNFLRPVGMRPVPIEAGNVLAGAAWQNLLG